VGDKGIVTDKFLLRQKFSATPPRLPLRGYGSGLQIPAQKQAVAFAYRPQITKIGGETPKKKRGGTHRQFL
jgi:hypothetical protein